MASPAAVGISHPPAFAELRGRAMFDAKRSQSLSAVSTVLTPTERIRVDAAGEGSYQALHRDTVEDVVRDLKANRAVAVLVSVARCDSVARASVELMVREFPRVPTVALLSQVAPGTPRTVPRLGQRGVRA